MKKILFVAAVFTLGIVFISSCNYLNNYNDTDLPKPISGQIIRLSQFKSKYIKARNIDVWVPDAFHPQNPATIMIMHDGQMLFDATKTWNQQEWGADETADKLIRQGIANNLIIVGIWNGDEDRHAEFFPQKVFLSLPEKVQDSLMQLERYEGVRLFSGAVRSDDYLIFIVEELIPHLKEHFLSGNKTNPIYIAGSSMGGLISIYALCEYPDVFSGAACLSTHWTGVFTALNNPIPHAFKNYLEQNIPGDAKHRIYFDYGTATLDSLYEQPQLAIDSVMVNAGYNNHNWITLKFEGADHSENSWQERLHIPFEFLLTGHSDFVDEDPKEIID